MPYKDPDRKREADKRAEERRKAREGERHRTWMAIVYPDSMPPDWRDILSDVHLPIWVSPVHDQDTWTARDERADPRHKAGMPKKPHRHVILQHPEKISREQFLGYINELNGPQNVKVVASLSSMVRYLVHMDDPDKAQYARDDCLVYGGASLDEMDVIGVGERHEMLRAMRAFIRDNGIIDFCDFVDYCDDSEKSWSRLLDDNSSYVIKNYIASIRAKARDCWTPPGR